MALGPFLWKRVLVVAAFVFRWSWAEDIRDRDHDTIRGGMLPPTRRRRRRRKLGQETYEWIQIGDTIVGEAMDDNSGNSVAINREGDAIAIGARTADSPAAGINAGHVRVFKFVEEDKSSGIWVQKGSDIDGDAEGDRSGYQVAMNAQGNIVAVSARFNDNAHGQDSGHVRVFVYDHDDDWTQMGQDLDGASTSEWLESVALSEDGMRVAIGASRHYPGSFHGQVRVFDYDSTSQLWLQIGQDLLGVNVGDRFGGAIDLSDSGNFLAVGGTGADCTANFNNNCGHVQVFEYVMALDTWIQLGSTLHGEVQDDYFGRALALSGDGLTLAVGANQHGNSTGMVQVFRYDTSSADWLMVGQPIMGEAANDRSGSSLALSSGGNIVAIGAWSNDSPFGTDSGHVRIYEYTEATDEWIQVGTDVDGEDGLDGFGWSVAMNGDGTRIVAGSPDRAGFDGAYKGAVRVFQYSRVTEPPSSSPSMMPTTASPTFQPTEEPTREPSVSPSKIPSVPPTALLQARDATPVPTPLLDLCLVKIGTFFASVTEWIAGETQQATTEDGDQV